MILCMYVCMYIFCCINVHYVRKKGATLFSTITLAFYGRFFKIIFRTIRNRNEYSTSHVIYLLDDLMSSQLRDIARQESLLHYNVRYEKCSTLFLTITVVILDRF